MNFPKYGSVENLYRCKYLLAHPRDLVVTEKLHGTNIRIMYSPQNGGWVYGSRNNVIYKDGVSTLDGYGFAAFFESHPAKEMFPGTNLCNDYVFYGEFIGSGIQKGVKYCEEKDFRVFDIRDPQGNFLDWDDVKIMCQVLKLKTVPEISRGRFTIDSLNQLMNVNSQCAIENGLKLEENIAEGIIIKPLQEWQDSHGNRMIAKYKSGKWAEVAKAPKRPRLIASEKMELINNAQYFAQNVVVPGRISTIMEHITRDGNTSLGPERTADFLRELIKDVQSEFKDTYSKLKKEETRAYNKAVSSLGAKLWISELQK